MTGLIADIGATNARFALCDDKGQVSDIRIFAGADYPTLVAAAEAYLAHVPLRPTRGIFSIAAPLDGGDQVSMTNHGWSFSVRDTARILNLDDLRVVNDFTAIALAVPHLSEGSDFYAVGQGGRLPGAPIALIGPGTGLGVAAIVFDAAGQPIVLPTEGGHVTVPVQTAREFAIVEWLLQDKYSHISAERVVSGKGLVNLYQAISALDKQPAIDADPAQIMARGLNKSCPRCIEAVDLFCHWLGSVAGNLALTYGAFGGVFIAGGIVPQMGTAFADSRFRRSFLAKGRYKDYLDRIATLVITHPQPGLLGLARQLMA